MGFKSSTLAASDGLDAGKLVWETGCAISRKLSLHHHENYLQLTVDTKKRQLKFTEFFVSEQCFKGRRSDETTGLILIDVVLFAVLISEAVAAQFDVEALPAQSQHLGG